MARSLCRCGTQVRWKADEPESDEWLLLPMANLSESIEDAIVVSPSAAFCGGCGRLWIAWDPDVDVLT